MPLRLAITLGLIGLGFGAYAIGTRLHTRQIATVGSSLLSGLTPGVPAVVYFWSEACAPCKLVQKPALEQLQSSLGPAGVQIVDVDVIAHPDLADEWGVLSLPTTFIIDGTGEPRRINHGVTRAEQLQKQIADVA